MSKKSLLSLVLVAGLLAPAASILATDGSSLPWDMKKRWDEMSITKKALYGGTSGLFTCFAISLYSLLYNEPTVHFESKGAWKDIINPKLLVKDPKKYFRNFSDVYWTKLVGQIFKDNELKLSSDGKPKMSKKKYPHGFMGNAYTHFYVLKKTSGVVGDFAKIITPVLTLCLIANRLEIIGLKERAAAESAPDDATSSKSA